MKTDSFFYRFFRQYRHAFFALIGEDRRKARRYKFTAVEVKELAFRFDGLFLAASRKDDAYFVEVQFKKDHRFYARFFAEVYVYEVKKMVEPLISNVKKSRFYRELQAETAQELTPKIKRELTPKIERELTPKIEQELTPKIEQETKRKIARELLLRKMSLELIAEATQLTPREVRTIMKNLAARKSPV